MSVRLAIQTHTPTHTPSLTHLCYLTGQLETNDHGGMLHFFLLTSNSLVVFVNLVFMSVSAPPVCLWTTCLSLQHLSVCGPSVRLWTTRLSLFRLFSTVGRLEEQLRSFDQSLKSFQAAEDKVQYDCWQPSVAPPPPPPPDLQRALVLRCLFSSSSYFFCCSSNFMTNALQHKRTHAIQVTESHRWPLSPLTFDLQ